MTSPPIRHPVRILGIDPGLRRTGWGVIEIDGNRLIFVGCGSVEPPDGLPLASRLLAIHEGLATVLGDFKPAEAAVEQTFVNKDGVATLKLGQARGVAMLAPAMFGITVAEYAPNQVKKTVVGAGHADKNQILVMLKILLPKAEPREPGAARHAPFGLFELFRNKPFVLFMIGAGFCQSSHAVLYSFGTLTWRTAGIDLND